MASVNLNGRRMETGQTHEAVSLQVFSAVKGCGKSTVWGKPHVELIDTKGIQWISADPDHVRWAIEHTFRGAPRTVTVMERP